MFLRTGRRPFERKFNPWHDPENGRFTFSGQGQFYGRGQTWTGGGFTGGGGGDSGGAGASSHEDWPNPTAPRAVKPRLSKPQKLPLKRTMPVTAIRSARPAVQKTTRRSANGYSFEIDAAGRTVSASGELRLGSVERRSRSLQRRAGGQDRLRLDDGGHFIAARFEGPRQAFNHFAQDRNFNRSAYRDLENRWATAVRSGQRVFVRVEPVYDGRSVRPVRLIVGYSVNSMRFFRAFANRSGGR